MAIRTDILFQEFLDTFHPLFVLYLIQRIEDGCRSAVIGHIQITDSCTALVFWHIKDVLFLHRTIIDNLFFFLCQVLKRNICAHAHLPADIRHQRPHQRIPRCNGPLVNGFAFIRNERCPVNSSYHSCATAAFTSSGGIKSKIFCPRRIEMLSTLWADQFSVHGSHLDAGFQIVTIGATMTGKT